MKEDMRLNYLISLQEDLREAEKDIKNNISKIEY